ncbi:HDOD domain-containing protein [Litorilituus lipolyticus]|uniref:HDOD domain-containing protein n=1 Tax=Litorilituus lipolyticus TaxID=2491017 RepID=A0A502L7P8_9GAMM|nr:HDOD domain-containing protein [Litorilituus lipolyticus]TPH18475.1 HDOD domain-containing protein [Litorilituus lipolyticus]
MTAKDKKNTQQWVELIAHSELPAITSTAQLLDKFSNDDKSSLPKLSKAILHDQALSSCILKIANGIQHLGVNKVTTVSRATVVLGIQSVKNICLTAKLVDSLLASKSLDIHVYNELSQSMANSFYAGMLAKMMVPGYSDELQEEVYLAAMLYRIGETAFWSVGGSEASKLAAQENLPPKEFNLYCQNHLGTTFIELSKGLASTWNLSDILVKALDQPENRTDEIRIIYFADQLSSIIASPGGDEEAFNHLLQEIASIMDISVRQLKARIEHTREYACKLLSSYGADILSERIKDLPTGKEFASIQASLQQTTTVTKEKELLNAFMQLTQLIGVSKDFNEYLQLALVDISKAFIFERSSFLMLVDNKTAVKSRFVYDEQGNKDSFKVKMNLTLSDNVLAKVINEKQPALINDMKHVHWRELITAELAKFMNDGSMALAPVKISNKVIGIICGQFLEKGKTVSSEDYRQFCALIEHLNMCLTMVMMK